MDSSLTNRTLQNPGQVADPQVPSLPASKLNALPVPSPGLGRPGRGTSPVRLGRRIWGVGVRIGASSRNTGSRGSRGWATLGHGARARNSQPYEPTPTGYETPPREPSAAGAGRPRAPGSGAPHKPAAASGPARPPPRRPDPPCALGPRTNTRSGAPEPAGPAGQTPGRAPGPRAGGHPARRLGRAPLTSGTRTGCPAVPSADPVPVPGTHSSSRRAPGATGRRAAGRGRWPAAPRDPWPPRTRSPRRKADSAGARRRLTPSRAAAGPARSLSPRSRARRPRAPPQVRSRPGCCGRGRRARREPPSASDAGAGRDSGRRAAPYRRRARGTAPGQARPALLPRPGLPTPAARTLLPAPAWPRGHAPRALPSPSPCPLPPRAPSTPHSPPRARLPRPPRLAAWAGPAGGRLPPAQRRAGHLGPGGPLRSPPRHPPLGDRRRYRQAPRRCRERRRGAANRSRATTRWLEEFAGGRLAARWGRRRGTNS